MTNVQMRTRQEEDRVEAFAWLPVQRWLSRLRRGKATQEKRTKKEKKKRMNERPSPSVLDYDPDVMKNRVKWQPRNADEREDNSVIPLSPVFEESFRQQMRQDNDVLNLTVLENKPCARLDPPKILCMFSLWLL